MPQFAVLVHDFPFLHWDFLLEDGDACRTWRILKSPDTPGELPTEPLPDHRLMYLTYEGPVSGDRGSVTAWDSGTFEWLVDNRHLVEVRLSGIRLSGGVRIEQPEGGNWSWKLDS